MSSVWEKLLAGWPWYQGEEQYPLRPYSECIPPPHPARKPYSSVNLPGFTMEEDVWPISEYEETQEIQPGLEHLAKEVLFSLTSLGAGRPAQGIPRAKLINNPYWPKELAQHAGSLSHERYVVILPTALSRTQDDKGRVRWTLFGNSEQGPSLAFWKGFYTAPGWEWPEEQSLTFVRNLLSRAHGKTPAELEDLHEAGFRILPREDEAGHLPAWTKAFLLPERAKNLANVRFLLTFRPFGELPPSVRKAYLSGKLHLLPFPGSMVFWGTPSFQKLQKELPMAQQIPLLHLIGRREGPHGLRVPQSGWLDEPREGEAGLDESHHGSVRNTFRRTHRWDRVHRHEDQLAVKNHEDKVSHVIFSSDPEHLGLYGKPMARNVQLWNEDYRLLLDGPLAGPNEIEEARKVVLQGGRFGYRFQYPAMRVGDYELYWHRPLVAFLGSPSGEAELLQGGPLGYFTAYPHRNPDLEHPLELWPKLLNREPHRCAVELFKHNHHHTAHTLSINARKLLETRELLDNKPLPTSLARELLTRPKSESLEEWLESIPKHASNQDRGNEFLAEIRRGLTPSPAKLPKALTYAKTAKRPFEVSFWKTIVSLSAGLFVNKNNGDCVRDQATQKTLCHRVRDLDALGDHILDYYEKLVVKLGMTREVLIGDLPFQWQTDFDYSWMGGWLNNKTGEAQERDLIVVIPGRDRSRAVVMCDHYDTAYMADVYDPHYGGNGARISACGADDNHSATAALMLGAPVFLELSKKGKLACDIWLVHLTGEEFPADCLGARHLAQSLVQGTLKMRLPNGKFHDLSDVRIQGLYDLDMIAHNNDRDRDTFQISPGWGSESMKLALHAHMATEIWNAEAVKWNKKDDRKERGRRSLHGGYIPKIAAHPILYGEVRPPSDPRSTLYNTDAMIFSDAGVPVVLFMEHYDINRSGYHDKLDTMANIDLDYGSAFAAITIETVARAASDAPC